MPLCNIIFCSGPAIRRLDAGTALAPIIHRLSQIYHGFFFNFYLLTRFSLSFVEMQLVWFIN